MTSDVWWGNNTGHPETGVIAVQVTIILTNCTSSDICSRKKNTGGLAQNVLKY